MNKMYFSLTTTQFIFIVIAVIVLAVIGVFVIYLPIRKLRMKSKFKDYCYKKIYKLVQKEDYYLINNFSFIVDKSKIAHIDHIVFGEKYIYVINSQYVSGDLTGNINDIQFVLVPKKGDKKYFDNPTKQSKYIASKLSTNTGIDSSYLIGITVINDECKVGIENLSKQFYIIQLNKLDELIKNIESRNVGKLDEEALDKAVKEISLMNRNRNKK